MSNILMVIATIVIAIFAGLSWYTTFQIKKDAEKRDNNINELFIKLTAGIMASGKTTGEPKMGARLFLQHEEAIRDAINKK